MPVATSPIDNHCRLADGGLGGLSGPVGCNLVGLSAGLLFGLSAGLLLVVPKIGQMTG